MATRMLVAPSTSPGAECSLNESASPNTTERFIREGPYNDIHEWAYHLVPQILQKGWGCEVRTEGELEEALITAHSNINSFSLINIHLDKLDHSRALKRLGRRLSKQAKFDTQ